jgi:beta-glucosidase
MLANPEGDKMVRATHHFPRGFLWGTATSSHQVEGGNTNNDWHVWESLPGKILEGHRSGRACDWWAGRWKEDMDRAAESAQNTHRLSIEWSRIEPTPAIWDDGALAYYREILEGILARDLKPMVTLHHFTNPLWVAEKGGWLNPEIVRWFERYVRKVLSALSDLVELWVTINEPNVCAFSAYLRAAFPPGHESLREAMQVTLNMTRAHAAAYHAIHQIQAGAQVGLAHAYRGMQPASARNPIHRYLAAMRDRIFNRAIPEALRGGKLSLLAKRFSLPEVRATQDFFGLNYYTREQVALDLTHPAELFSRGFYAQDADLSETGFISNDPEGFWLALGWANGYRMPIFVTENGVEDSRETLRPRYLVEHLLKLWRAVNFNWPVLGYYHWTLVDNFEWERGWTQRFGLWELDPETQARRPRTSVDLYAQICRTNGLSTDMVGKYAPGVFDKLFPV